MFAGVRKNAHTILSCTEYLKDYFQNASEILSSFT